MSPVKFGAILDNLILLGIGIGFIYMSIKQKEKLGKKAGLAMLGGIIAIIYAVFLFVIR